MVYKMKRLALILTLTLPCICFASPRARELKFPKPYAYVNDYVNIIDRRTEAYLNSLLRILEERTGAQVAVVTIDTTSPYEIEYYAVNLFEKWGIGKKGEDNGVLLLIALKDRKLRIEVGYGLEGALPDAVCKRIIYTKIIPYFKRGQYSEGIASGINEIVKRVADEYGVDLEYPRRASGTVQGDKGPGFSLLINIFLLFLFLLLFRFLGFYVFFIPWGFGGGYWGSGRGGFGGFGGFGGGLSGGGGASGSW